MSQISAPTNIDSAVRQGNGFSALSSDEFIRIIFTELANQDPFEPSDSSALLDQLNTIRAIESDLQLIDNLEALVLQNQLAAGASLIGKTVSGLSTTNDNVTGRVTAVRRQGDSVRMELDNGAVVPFESMTSIVESNPPVPGQQPAAGGP